MSSQTLTNTSWGDMTVSYEDDGQSTAMCRCKHCGSVTTQTLSADDNPFEVAKPVHKKGCKLHPDTPAPVTVSAREHRARTSAPVIEPPRGLASQVTWGQLALWTAMLIGATITGAVLW